MPPETGNGFLTGTFFRPEKNAARMHFVDLARKQVESELELVCVKRMVVSVVADWFDDGTEQLRFRIIKDPNQRGNKRFRLKCKEGSNQARVSFVTSHVCAICHL